MAYSAETPSLLSATDERFVGGGNSHDNPVRLPPVQYYWAENVENERDDLQTRWGFTNILKFSCGRAQGMALFQPTNVNIPSLYIAISGEIWRSVYPFEIVTKLTGIQFRPDLDMVTFKEAIVTNTPSAAVSPYKVLIMQDGISPAAYTDGVISRHLDPTPDGFYNPFSIGAKETRIGLTMEFVGLRLWVANGRELFASDVGDPLHFIETTYLAGGGSFQAYDGNDITCLKRTTDGKQLLAGTQSNTTAFDAGNTVRSTWATSPDFERLLFAGVGWTGPKCAGELNGELFWQSKEGFRLYNIVGSAAFSARRAISSQEQLISWENRAPILSRCCAGSFESYALMGVPSGDQYNRHIWALNTSSNDLLTENAPYSWLPIWKGIRPVEFVSGNVNGMNRIFCLEQGRDIPRVWELFGEKRRDYYLLGGELNERKIKCRVQSRGIDFGERVSFKVFSHLLLHIEGLRGNVSLTTQFKNEYGCYTDIGSWNLCSKECTLISSEDCNIERVPNTQSRFLTTQKALPSCNEGGSPYQQNIGTYFTFQHTWEGEMAIRAVRYFGEQFVERNKGACQSGDSDCPELACCNEELDYWSSPEELFPYYYYNNDSTCVVFDASAE